MSVSKKTHRINQRDLKIRCKRAGKRKHYVNKQCMWIKTKIL